MAEWNIPQHLDNPPRILMFTVPEGVVVIISLFVGAATGLAFVIVPFGLLLVFMMRQFAELMDRFSGFQAYIYWFVFYRPSPGFKPSYIRFWKG